MKLKLLLAYTIIIATKEKKHMFYMTGDYNRDAILRYQLVLDNTGFYIGRKSHSEFDELNTYLKKL